MSIKVLKSTGVVRKLDELGRITLPMSLRQTYNLKDQDSMEIFVEGEQIILRKYEPACVFCGEAKGVRHFKGKNICPTCLSLLRSQAS